MKIVLKNVKFSESLSEETNAFTADLWVDGKKVGYCRNSGQGGCTDVHSFSETRKEFVVCEEYCKTLPEKLMEHEGMKSNLENVVDDLFEKWLKDKESKRMEKFDLTHVRWGVPNGLSYMSVSFKKPIKDYPHIVLQSYLDKWKREIKTGEQFLNTNLQGFNL